MTASFSFPRQLLGISQLSILEINGLLETASGFLGPQAPQAYQAAKLPGKTVLTVFFEASTRTRVSFELAAQRLGATCVHIASLGSSVSKGESLRDTLQTLDAMQADLIVLRHSQSGAAQFVARDLRAALINAGDGQHEHPSQALADLLTLKEHFKTLTGLQVAIIGDVLHSRVARSNLQILHKVGIPVRVAGPRVLLPKNLADAYGCTVCDSLEEAVQNAHVVMVLRLQHERMQQGLVASLAEYARRYAIDLNTLQLAAPNVVVMHPGPVNRGVELKAEVIDDPRCLMLKQVEAGVAMRAALLSLMLRNQT